MTGWLEGRQVVVAWNAGDLDGDATAVAYVEQRLADARKVHATPTGPGSRRRSPPTTSRC